MNIAASEAADHANLKMVVPTGQRTMKRNELIPCFAIPCVGLYCSPHHICGCAATNQCICLSWKMREVVKLCKCGKEGDSISLTFFNFTFVLKKPAPKCAIELESWTPLTRDLILLKGEVGCFGFKIEVPDGCGCYRPSCSKPICGCKLQNKCCCCVQESALPFGSPVCACFGLALLPGIGCCKTMGKDEPQERKEEMMNGGSPKIVSKKKKKKAKVSPGFDAKGMMSNDDEGL